MCIHKWKLYARSTCVWLMLLIFSLAWIWCFGVDGMMKMFETWIHMIIHVFLPFFDVFIAFLSYMTVGEENIAVGVHLMLSAAVCASLTYVTLYSRTLPEKFSSSRTCVVHLTYVDQVSSCFTYAKHYLACVKVNSRTSTCSCVREPCFSEFQWLLLVFRHSLTYVTHFWRTWVASSALFRNSELSNVFIFNSNVLLFIKSFCSSSKPIRNLLLITHDPTVGFREVSRNQPCRL